MYINKSSATSSNPNYKSNSNIFIENTNKIYARKFEIVANFLKTTFNKSGMVVKIALKDDQKS